MSKIHHTMGVYLNGDRKHNGVAEENLEDHARYNLAYRPGRAFFIDGECVHRGYLSEERCKEIEAELAANPVVMVKDTQPYI